MKIKVFFNLSYDAYTLIKIEKSKILFGYKWKKKYMHGIKWKKYVATVQIKFY